MPNSIEQQGTAAVKRLRSQKLANGLPFMINSDELPSGQCYLEQPDGSIQLATLATNGHDFTVLRTLSSNESETLRQKYELSDFIHDS